MHRFFSRKKKQSLNDGSSKGPHEPFEIEVYENLDKNIDTIKKMLHSPSDLVTRPFTIGRTSRRCAVISIDGLTDKDLINRLVVRNIQQAGRQLEEKHSSDAWGLLNKIEESILSVTETKRVQTLDDISLAILDGDSALFVDGTDQVIIIGSKGWASRGVQEPITEALVRGPRDGFTESIRTNTALIRRRVRDPNLRFDSYKVGRRSKKDLIVAYIDGIVNPSLVEEVQRRVKTIDLDDAEESGLIEQWIEDSFLSPFPQLQHTERPDKVGSALTQGRLAILLDGTPFVLIAPVTLNSMLQSPEDYYERWHIGTLLRLLRFAAAFIALFLPALYVALLTYHPGMIPSKIVFSLAEAREGVPFPAVVEALMMEATLELLREAGIRLPKPIGQTIGIVGGLVIGEAAVSAGIVSPIMVIVVAITAIASFALPSYDIAIPLRMLRFGLILAASIYVLFGIILVYIMINIHLVRLKSFGVPFTAPFAPQFTHDFRDVIIRVPLMFLRRRPQVLQTDDKVRIGKGGKRS